jgi:hypothetical protein
MAAALAMKATIPVLQREFERVAIDGLLQLSVRRCGSG